MSRSNPNETVNPTTRYFEWRGGEGVVTHYDKEAKKNIPVDFPFTFLVLDQLNCITGFMDSLQCGIYSNETRDIKEEFVVKNFKNGEMARGNYGDVIDATSRDGAKFAKSVYIAYKDGEELKIGNIKFSGSALGPWFDFTKKNKVYDGAVQIIGKSEEKKKGATKYFEPVFAKTEVKENTNKIAVDLDNELQDYLNNYLSRRPENKPVSSTPEPQPHDEAPVTIPGESDITGSWGTPTKTAAPTPSSGLPF